MWNDPATREVRSCEVTGRRFLITEQERDFLRRLTEQNPWFGSPLLPRVKPCEALRRMFASGNMTFLNRVKSALSGTSVLSRYSERDGYRVVTTDEFWSDRVENTEYGRAYDFSRPFFPQFHELMRAVYHVPLNQTNVENSDYVNGGQNIRNCYLCFSILNSQDCLYCLNQFDGNDNIDCVGSVRCQFCFACVDIDGCYECEHCADSWSCSNCFGCVGCRSCRHCLGCSGLEQAEYCAFNQQLDKTSYTQLLAELCLSSHAAREQVLRRCEAATSECRKSLTRHIQTENCSGAYIARSANIHESIHVVGSTDCGYLAVGVESQDCWKGYYSKSQLCYQSTGLNMYNVGYSVVVRDSQDCWYSYFLYGGCAHCFGCAQLKGESYCILNRRYSREEYQELLPRIVAHMRETGEWGMFLSPKLSPHPYSESLARDYLADISDAEILRRGYRPEPAQELAAAASGRRVLDASELPDAVDGLDLSEFAGAVLRCEQTGNNFNLQRRELEFYARFRIPLPRVHWRARMQEKILGRVRIADELDVVDPHG